MPAYSATEVFTYLRSTYPDYSYKEASLNPTNLRNRAVDWETDVIQIFRNHPEMKEFSSERETPGGKGAFSCQAPDRGHALSAVPQHS